MNRRTVVLTFMVLAAFAPAAHAAALKAPAVQAPSAGASVEALPAFTWAAVRGAAQYEFQLAADPQFASIVLGKGAGKGTFHTRNTAATVTSSVPDGTYYWRVRAITSKDLAGRWSLGRKLVKAWTTAPQLQTADGLQVAWPVAPLVLSWSAVPHATKYLLTIATDEGFANPVLGTAIKPQETQGTTFALPSSLPPGQYFWAVTPQDASGHRGMRSARGSFTWLKAPAVINPRVTDLRPDEPRVYDPQFSWDPVPGAAKYEVEVNSAAGFPAQSKWCCTEVVIGTSLTPKKVLANNTYFWRVRSFDSDGNAGDWFVGPSFAKTFDEVDPFIPNLSMRDINLNPKAGAPYATDTPIVAWDPVPGASQYSVQILSYSGGGCQTPAVSYVTAVPYWTPLTFTNRFVARIGPAGWPLPRVENSPQQFLAAGGARYCVRVTARSDDDAKSQSVESQVQPINGFNQPAFQFDDPPATSGTPPLAMTDANYIAPITGSSNIRTPLFTWSRVNGARSYYVVVARDASFTKIADIGLVNVPAYAPRLNADLNYPTPFLDETTAYYWKVIPSPNAGGSGLLDESPAGNAPRPFNKLSDPPTLTGPGNGADVPTQPTFSWTPVESARTYRLQVAQDPSFGAPIDDVVTSSTAFTTSSTYPADTQLYWRVRANDVNGNGQRWSDAISQASFRRVLPVPTPRGDNPAGGSTIPVLSWNPVPGAISYDLHVDQANGTVKDFTVRSTSFTPTLFYGTGIWKWRVRATFPTTGKAVSGGYFAPQNYVRTIPAPTGATGLLRAPRGLADGRTLLSWNPSPVAKQYQVDISTSDSFGTTIASVKTDHTSWAPDNTQAALMAGGKLYWRVGVLDEGNNVGAYANGTFTAPRAIQIAANGLLLRRRMGVLKLKLTDTAGKAVSKATVRISGAGIRPIRRVGSKLGRLTVRVRPRRPGKVVITASRTGYRNSRTTVLVR